MTHFVISVCYSTDDITIATIEQSNINGDRRYSLPWPFLLLCMSNSIIRYSLSQFIWSAITQASFPSLHRPLYTHSPYTWRTKLSQNLNKPSILFCRSTWGAITEMWRWQPRFTSLVCLSSLVTLFFTSVTFSSSSKPLFPHFIDPSTLTVCTCNVWNIE